MDTAKPGRHRDLRRDQLAEGRALAAERSARRSRRSSASAPRCRRLRHSRRASSRCPRCRRRGSCWPVRICEVARPVPTTAGSPYSRHTIAAWDMTPPMSVTVGLDLREDRRPRRRGDAADEDLAVTDVGDLARRPDDARDALDHARRRRGAVQLARRPRLVAPTRCTRSVVTPQSMIVIGSVIASGIAPSAGGGVHSPSRSSSSLRRCATIGGQCVGPSGCAAGRPGQHELVERRAHLVARQLEDVLARRRGSRASASSAPNSRILFHQRVRNQ